MRSKHSQVTVPCSADATFRSAATELAARMNCEALVKCEPQGNDETPDRERCDAEATLLTQGSLAASYVLVWRIL